MIDDHCLFYSTVPVMQRYVRQSIEIANKIPLGKPDALKGKLSDDGFACAEHLWIAQNFAMRGVCPVRGVNAPDFGAAQGTVKGIVTHGRSVLTYLSALEQVDFDGAAARMVAHRAGQADLAQPGTEYLLHFIVPNMLFHLVTGYAILRSQGVALGKADFDGLHAYPAGFSFA